jgi:hypothetical protein
MRHRWSLVGVVVLCAGLLAATPSQAAPSGGWNPARKGLLDCNGYSPVQLPVAHLQCAEITGNEENGLFEDNGHYVGHDEPSTQVFSNVPGSGYSSQYHVTLPTDPAKPPNGTVEGPVWNFQTHIAPWFSMTLCDDESYPEGSNTCTPDSDTNIQVPPQADHAGAAFEELQFYPPGYPPFINSISCDTTHWCAAMAIFSLQASFGFAQQNVNCIEPANFAFLTKSGDPIGPPGPDTANEATFTPTPDVLVMNPGDELVVSLYDTPGGFTTTIEDVTTGETGMMVASADNGFRHILWDPTNFTCQGAPYTFRPMYATAHTPTMSGQPTAWATWSAHTSNVGFSDEIGHFETPDGDGDDLNCHDGPYIPGCLGTDTDFDGFSYQPDWPDGDPLHPTPFLFSQPTFMDSNGDFTRTFQFTRFETDLPRIEARDFGHHCDRQTGENCVNPPRQANFYPWMHTIDAGGCRYALSDDGVPGEISNFGGEQAAWGNLLLTDYGFDSRYNNFASAIMRSPCRAGG